MSPEHTTPLDLLSDDARAWLDGTMARNRTMFAGWSMDASEGADGDAGEPDADEPGQEPDDGGDDKPADDDKPAEKDPDESKVRKANEEAKRYRTELRALQDEQKNTKDLLSRLTKALTGESDKDAPADPKELASRIDSLTETVATQAVHLAVYDLAPKAGGNASALLDSRKFADSIKGLDPGKDADKITEAIKAAVKQNAAYRLTQGSARGGGDIDADKREGVGPTKEEFNKMSFKQRVELKASNPSAYRRLAGN